VEINITNFFENAAPMDYSASIAEIGASAGEDTFQAAKDDTDQYNMINTEEKRGVFREYVAKFGAWEEEEITAWDNIELNALFIQLVSGDIRENEHLERGDWEAYEADEDARGSIGRCTDGGIWYSIYE